MVLFLSSAVAEAPGTGQGTGTCEGGALRLYGGDQFDVPVDIAPEAGMLVAFRSTVLHEVLPVTAGVRDVIVDWFY